MCNLYVIKDSFSNLRKRAQRKLVANSILHMQYKISMLPNHNIVRFTYKKIAFVSIMCFDDSIDGTKKKIKVL